MSTSEKDNNEPLPLHEKAWNQKQFFVAILSRYVDVLDEIGGMWPAFSVQEKKEDDDIHQQLDKINRHLSRLDWSVGLHPDEPWMMHVFPLPIRQFPSRSVPIVMWFFALLSTLYAAETWMSSGRPDGGWFHSNIVIDGFLGYALPVLGVILAASFVHKSIANYYGIRVPHLLPIFAFPATWWPFGLLGVVSIPRMDARFWPNRAALGWSAISVPLILISTGMIFVLCGIYLSPSSMDLVSSPLRIELPLFAQYFGLGLLGERAMLLGTVFVHPLTYAGCTLVFFGWVSLIPIPTFPGGRLLMARMGVREARSSSTQMLLLFTLVIFGILFQAFSGFSTWTVILVLSSVMLLTRGTDPRFPVVLDDAAGLKNEDHRRLGLYLFLAFVLALPAQVPYSLAEDWDESIRYELDETHYFLNENSTMIEIILVNDGWLERGWSAEVLVNQSDKFQWSCYFSTQESENCNGILGPKEKVTLQINVTWLEDEDLLLPKTDFFLSFFVDGKESLREVTISSKHSAIPQSSYWSAVGTFFEPKFCVDLSWTNTDSHPFVIRDSGDFGFYFEGTEQLNITQLDHNSRNVCIEGNTGANWNSLSEILLDIQNHSFSLSPPRVPVEFVIPSEGIEINATKNYSGWGAFDDGGVLVYGASNICDSGTTLGYPNKPSTGDWIWDLAIRKEAKIPEVDENQSLIFQLDEGSIFHHCLENKRLPLQTYSVITGPEVILLQGDTYTRFWTGFHEIHENNLSFFNPTNETVRVTFQAIGDGWSVPDSTNITGNVVTNIQIDSPQEDSYLFIKAEPNLIKVYLVE